MKSFTKDDTSDVTPPFVAGLYVILGWLILGTMTVLGMLVVWLPIFGIAHLIGIDVPEEGWVISLSMVASLFSAMGIGYYLTNWIVDTINKRLPRKWHLLSASDIT